MGDLTKDFSISEVRCKCPACVTSQVVPTMEVMLLAQAIRDDLDKPLVIKCGVRCIQHNQDEHGAPDSRHLPQYRDALDIECLDSYERYCIIKSAIAHGCRFIEVCPNHIHLDMRPTAFKLICGSDN